MSLQITILDESLKTKVPAFASLTDYEVRSVLLAEVVRAELSNLRAGNAHTKTRAEVRGGGKKPWKQKGTGRARHGSTRSPIWVGGGVTFGPRSDRNWHLKINKGARLAALKSIFKDRLANEVVYQFSDSFNYDKTKDAVPSLFSIRNEKSKSDKQTCIVYTSADKEMLRGFTNTDAKMMNVLQLKVHTLVNSLRIVFTPSARLAMEERLA